MTLPRPVRVEFARTIPAGAAPSSPSPPITPVRAPRSKNREPLQQAEVTTKLTPSAEEAQLGVEEQEGGDNRFEGVGEEAASMAPLRNSRTSERETDVVMERNPLPAGEEYHNGENTDHSDNVRSLAAGEEGEERHRQEPLRPQRHGTFPTADWETNSADVDGGGVGSDREKEGQSLRRAGAQERGGEEKESQLGRNNNERPLMAPRRPQRHGTLPEGSDWEENLRSGRGDIAANQTASPLLPAPATDEESEEASWSMAEETTLRSSPTNGSHSPTRSFCTPNTRRSQLVLTPDGSDSSAWSRVLTDGVDSIQRWLHVR